MLNNNYSPYAALDQPLWQESEGAGGLDAFLQVIGAPGDRNLVDFYFDTGLTYKGPFGREDDKIGSRFPYTRIGDAARSLDADTTATTPAYPVRSRETLLDVGYKFQVTRSCSPISGTSSIEAAAFPTPTPRRGGSAMPQCSG